jgi:hypothetical protein
MSPNRIITVYSLITDETDSNLLMVQNKHNGRWTLPRRWRNVGNGGHSGSERRNGIGRKVVRCGRCQRILSAIVSKNDQVTYFFEEKF